MKKGWNHYFDLYKITTNFAIAFGALFLAGCGLVQEKLETVTPEEAFQETHFISAAPMVLKESGISEYQASCSMHIDNVAASLVLGDARGEAGRLFLCELSDGPDSASFAVKEMINGEMGEALAEPMEVPHNEDNLYHVELSVSEGSMEVKINGSEIGTVPGPGFDLGTIGVYKHRGVSGAYIDDILIKQGGDIIAADDFDGNFVNNLYPYEYENDPIGVFSPYYFKTEEDNGSNSLFLKSGLFLTESYGDPSTVFTTRFEGSDKKKKVKNAYVCVAALGSYDLYLNGHRISNEYFATGRNTYDQSIDYIKYEITEYMRDDNELSIELFRGFFDRGLGYPEIANNWGDTNAVKACIVVEYKDGMIVCQGTDGSFDARYNMRNRYASIYHGEIIDERYESGLQNVGSETIDIRQDEVDGYLLSVPLKEKANEPIREIETITPVSVTEPVTGHFVYDLGRNFAGTIRIQKQALRDLGVKEGQVLTFRYGEILNSENMVNADNAPGTVWTENLLGARATDYYIFGEKSGSGEADTIEFSHTYHGFRYLEITGLETALPPEAVKGVVLSSDIKETGSFTCSNDLINAYFNNSRNSMRSNMMDIPTDCPQRDERLGWSGDAQITSLFAMYNYDAKKFYENYLELMLEQQDGSGAFMDIAPFRDPFGGHSCWGDAPVQIAWNLYLHYGDIQILEKSYPSLAKWADYLAVRSHDVDFFEQGYGDHLSAQTTLYSATNIAWAAHTSRLVSKIAQILDNGEDAGKYAKLADDFATKWQIEHIRSDWSVEGGILIAATETETAYSLGLAFDLFPEDMRDAAAERLKMLTEYGGYLFYPGYSGMAYYLPALTDYGYGDHAFRVLTNTAPGGLTHFAAQGYTTNPETLTAISYNDQAGNPYPEGSYRIDGSLNHAAYSGPAAFLYSHILGIQPDENAPGYKHFYVKPVIMEGLDAVSGSMETKYGTISVSYDKNSGTMKVAVPKDTTCTLTLPSGEERELKSGEQEIHF